MAAATAAAMLALGVALRGGPGATGGERAHAGATASPAPAVARPSATSTAAVPLPTAAPPSTAHVPVAVAAPTRVSVPSVGIDVELVPLGLEPDGSLEVPTDFAVGGWYVDGPEPGEPGAAVIVGHVDSYEGPAAFFSLRHVEPGAVIEVSTADGTHVEFVVESVAQHPKSAFPSEDVFAATPGPTLRLVTCGGDFDRAARSYVDNVIVFAAPRPPA